MTQYTLSGPMLEPLSGHVKKIVVFLHGYGSNGDDLISLADHFAPYLKDCLFLSPNAIEPFVIGDGAYQWFELPSLDLQNLQKGLIKAVPILKGYLDNLLNQYKLEPKDMALVGFSQGAMMALRTAPLFEKPLAGAVAYSGAFIPDVHFESAIKTKPPMALIHGNADTCVPPHALIQGKTDLQKLGFSVQDLMIPGLGHGIDAEGLGFGLGFLKEAFHQ
jgi:phospholipase/carboxylesterase